MKVTIYLVLFGLSLSYALDRSGQYNPDSTGEYFPTNEGQYIHDDSGRYIPDYSGLYHDDGTGRYKHLYDPYRDNQGSASHIKPQVIKPLFSTPPPPNVRYGKYDDSRWRIIRLLNNVNGEGFHWEYETENEIEGEENAKVLNKGTKDESIATKGFYQYTGPDNIIYNVEYTADENGFIPKADHLPISLQRAIALHAKGTDRKV